MGVTSSGRAGIRNFSYHYAWKQEAIKWRNEQRQQATAVAAGSSSGAASPAGLQPLDIPEVFQAKGRLQRDAAVAELKRALLALLRLSRPL